MRISDWSSDVCSSDLPGIAFRGASGEGRKFGREVRIDQAGITRPRTVMQKAAYDFDALFAQKPKPRIRPTKVEFVGMPGADLFPKDRIANCFDAQLDDPVNVAGALVMSSFGNLVSPNIAYAGDCALRSEEHTSELQSLMS